RSAQHLLAGVVAMRLGYDACVLRELGDRGMVVVVNILVRVGQHERRMDGAVDVHKSVERILVEGDWVVSKVPELNVGDAETFGGGFSFLLTLDFDTLQRHAL